jgi:UDP-N-acetylmuramyl pentapeptide synthase/poly-gamma-glutamate capsule biosynthesis protein CapA/YwtB (metallophosphatase superfamily)
MTHRAQTWPSIGSPRHLAKITEGHWTSEPDADITAIRHSLVHTEPELRDFLYAPELFAEPNSPATRSAMLASGEAVAKGAAGIIATSRPRNLSQDIPCLIVDDARLAVRRLSEYNRERSGAKFIAVTGTVGKSTTKSMIQSLASRSGPALRSIANYNNGMRSLHFALSNLSPAHRYCVVEFSEDVDLDQRMTFFRPHVAVITNIMFEHIDVMEQQGYTGEAAIRRLAYQAAGATRFMANDGICVLNADAENFDIVAEEVRKSPAVRLVTFGTSNGSDVAIRSIRGDTSGSDIEIEIEKQHFDYRLAVPGRHMAENSVAAAVAAHFSGVDLRTSLDAFATFAPESRRGTQYKIAWGNGEVLLFDETFGSSVPSLYASFELLELATPSNGGRRIAVLGLVDDIGMTTPDVMTDLARKAECSSIDRFYTIGFDVRILNDAIKDRSRISPHCQTLAQLEAVLKVELKAGDVVLMKGANKPAITSLKRLMEGLVNDKSYSSSPGIDAIGEPVVRVVVGGDTYFGEYYQEKRVTTKKEINYLEAFGYDYSGRELAPLLRRADFSIVNLECALTDATRSKFEGQKEFILAGKPARTIEALKNLGVGGILLGNNHAMDFQEEGLLETLRHLELAGFQTSGAGKNRLDAQRPILRQFDVNGIPFKLAVLSGCEYSNSADELGLFAGSTTAGINNVNFDRMKQQVAALKSDGYYIIASPHWGANYCFRTYDQSRLAKRFATLGVDLVLGHGPHMINEVAEVDGIWMIYSLGNFIFNSEGEYEQKSVPPFSLMAEIEMRRRGSGVEGLLNLYPIVSCNQLTQFQPAFVNTMQFEQVTRMLRYVHYDWESLNKKTSQRQVDGRHCLTLKLF